MLLARQGKIEEGLSCFQKVLSIRPDYAEAHFLVGSLYAKQGNQAEALEHYRTLQGLNASLAQALLQEIEAVP
jgi:tetratricopeptide (TPR) repeat protein